MISLVYFSLFFNLILAQSNINIPDDVEFIKIGDKLSSSTWGQGLRLLYPWIDQNFQNELQKGTSYETKGIVLNNKTEQTLNKKQRVVCFYLSDIKNTMLCLFQTMDVMMAVTGRAMLYAWANTDIKGETSLFYDNGDIDCNSGLANKVLSYMNYCGANLRGKDLGHVLKNLGTNKSLELLPDLKIEKKFYDKIIRPELKDKDFNFALASAVVIEIEPRGRTDDDAIILHELLHAKYSLEQDFRKFIDKYIDAELKKKNSEASRILKDINENLLNTYPEINTNAYLRNNEIFVRLLIPIPKTAKECQDTTLLENKIRDAMALYEKINAQKFILPYLWYNIHSVWSYKDTNKKFFKSKFIDYVCNRTIKFEL